jgi:energy-coupling factor transport system ATP-binding protein
MPAAETAHLTYTYPERTRPALRDLTLRLDHGLVLLAGKSGSGKSTLLRALCGLVPHFHGGRFAGRVVVDGLDTRHARPVELAERVGLVFQEPATRFVTGTVSDEVAFGMEAAGLRGDQIRRTVEEIVERLELGPVVGRSLDRLSGGEQQRVAVAAALARGSRVLLMDEPTSQLDAQSADGVLSWIQELHRDLGLLALIAEHRLARLADSVDGILYLEESGALGAYGQASEVMAAMPYGPPLVEAARRLDVPLPFTPPAREALRSRLEGLAGIPPRREPAGAPRLAAQGLHHAYNGVPALEDAGLEMRAGEVVAILGRNGSGKTTLLRCLMGLVQPDRGEVWLEGRRIDQETVAARAREIAFVPQWPSAMLFAESVREELTLTLRNHGLETRLAAEPDRLLGDLGLAEVAGRYPRDLAAGEQQRVAVGAVLVSRPAVLLLDEPTLGLDALAQRRLGEILETQRGRGVAIAVATHDVEFAAAHADTALVLEAGRVTAVGPAAETLFSHPALRTSLQRFTGRPRPASVEELPGSQRPPKSQVGS